MVTCWADASTSTVATFDLNGWDTSCWGHQKSWHTPKSSAKVNFKSTPTTSLTYSHCLILWSLLDWDGEIARLLGYHTVLGWAWLDQLKCSWVVRPKHPLCQMIQTLKLSPPNATVTAGPSRGNFPLIKPPHQYRSRFWQDQLRQHWAVRPETQQTQNSKNNL